MSLHFDESTGNGIVTSSGAEVEVQVTSAGITCIYSTNNTQIGILTDSAATSGTATMHANSSAVPRTGGSFFCGSSGVLTGSYTITSPEALYFDK